MPHEEDDPSMLAHPTPHRGEGSGLQLWLVRHAEVHEQWQGKAYGDLDVPLSRGGEQRTEELARDLAALPPTALLSSPLQRARRLATGIEELANIQATLDPGLREISRGSWQGKSVETLHAEEPESVADFYRDPWNWKGHGGECDRDVHARAWPPIERAITRTGGVVVVTTHYNVLRVLVASALDIAPMRSFALRVDTGHGVLLVDGPKGWELARSNASRPGL